MENKKETKMFYKFLVGEGILFMFLDLLKNTKFKNLETHCTRNRPILYVRNAISFGLPSHTPQSGRLFWRNVDMKWNTSHRKQTEIKKVK